MTINYYCKLCTLLYVRGLVNCNSKSYLIATSLILYTEDSRTTFPYFSNLDSSVEL